MARARLLDVPCHESRQARAGRTLRLDLKPQLRRPPRLQGPHAPRITRHGRRRRHRRTFRRRAGVALAPARVMADLPSDPLAWRPVKAPSLAELEVLASEVFRHLPSRFRELCADVVIQI